MSDLVTIAALATIAPTLLGMAALISSLRNGKKSDEVRMSINGRMDELMRLAKQNSFAAGEKAEIKRAGDEAKKVSARLSPPGTR